MKRIDKPWGYEELIEHNDKYVVKRLKMNKGHKCSIQYHKVKKETIYVLSGTLKVYMGNKLDDLDEIVMGLHDTLTLEPLKIHRMEAIEDCFYLEASTPELDDVVRLLDEYGREGKSKV
ncbi:MAG: cupin [Bacteroidetes bacterium]|nr:cupin [Bacteroidota bacterium]